MGVSGACQWLVSNAVLHSARRVAAVNGLKKGGEWMIGARSLLAVRDQICYVELALRLWPDQSCCEAACWDAGLLAPLKRCSEGGTSIPLASNSRATRAPNSSCSSLFSCQRSASLRKTLQGVTGCWGSHASAPCAWYLICKDFTRQSVGARVHKAGQSTVRVRCLQICPSNEVSFVPICARVCMSVCACVRARKCLSKRVCPVPCESARVVCCAHTLYEYRQIPANTPACASTILPHHSTIVPQSSPWLNNYRGECRPALCPLLSHRHATNQGSWLFRALTHHRSLS